MQALTPPTTMTGDVGAADAVVAPTTAIADPPITQDDVAALQAEILRLQAQVQDATLRQKMEQHRKHEQERRHPAAATLSSSSLSHRLALKGIVRGGRNGSCSSLPQTSERVQAQAQQGQRRRWSTAADEPDLGAGGASRNLTPSSSCRSLNSNPGGGGGDGDDWGATPTTPPFDPNSSPFYCDYESSFLPPASERERARAAAAAKARAEAEAEAEARDAQRRGFVAALHRAQGIAAGGPPPPRRIEDLDAAYQYQTADDEDQGRSGARYRSPPPKADRAGTGATHNNTSAVVACCGGGGDESDRENGGNGNDRASKNECGDAGGSLRRVSAPELSKDPSPTDREFRTGAGGGAGATTTRTGRRRRVSFHTVEVREYEQILGDHPCVASGPPLAIGWNYRPLPGGPLPVDAYENCNVKMPSHPLGCDYDRFMMVVPRHEREQIITEKLGYSQAEVARAVRETNKVKGRRRTTHNNLPFMAVEEAVEGAMRKLRKMTRQLACWRGHGAEEAGADAEGLNMTGPQPQRAGTATATADEVPREENEDEGDAPERKDEEGGAACGDQLDVGEGAHADTAED